MHKWQHHTSNLQNTDSDFLANKYKTRQPALLFPTSQSNVHAASDAMFRRPAWLCLRFASCIATQQSATFWGLRTQVGGYHPQIRTPHRFLYDSPQSFIILCLLVRKLSCWQTNKQTNKPTHKETDPGENIQCSSGELRHGAG